MRQNKLAQVRQSLSQRYDHFYHFTTDERLPSIQQRGLDPAFEDPRRYYAERANEPKKAMRFFTLDPQGIAVGLSAAVARTQEFIDGIWQQGSLKPALLRVKSESLLNRSFGLDHSFGQIREAMQSCSALPPREFNYIREFGIISAYDVIPPAELELCTTGGVQFLSDRRGQFAPLTEVDITKFGDHDLAKPETA